MAQIWMGGGVRTYQATRSNKEWMRHNIGQYWRSSSIPGRQAATTKHRSKIKIG